MLATSYAVPVVVCCETYKFGERIQLDAVVANEMGEWLSFLSFGDVFGWSWKGWGREGVKKEGSVFPLVSSRTKLT